MRTARTLEAERRQVLQGSVSTGGKGRWVKYWARLGCWISPCCGLFSLGVLLKLYELNFFDFQIFYPRITETTDTESADTGAHL
jgi:hypothetical protein